MKKYILSGIGVLGTIACLYLFLQRPSWPTPDKILVLLTFIFMIFHQGMALLKRFAPFVALLLVYESFRGVVPYLNGNVNIMFMPWADEAMFGALPTAVLQQWLWNGQVQWYDFAIYLVYMLHFVLPLALALVVWKFRPKFYWQVVGSFVLLSFAGFLTFLAFPAAPPWMAARDGYIQPITRISSDVWAALGVNDFPSVYNKISPNPVAAVPSLHSAYATLFALWVIKLFRSRWSYLALVYPLIIYFGTVYQGEHYVIDAILGVAYAVIAWRYTPVVLRSARRVIQRISRFRYQRLVPAEEEI